MAGTFFPFRREPALILLLLALNASGCVGSTLQRYEFTRLQMGVQARIVLYASDGAAASDAAAAAFAEVARLDAIMSNYRPESELMRLCAAPAGKAVAVSEDLFNALSAAQQISTASDGAFDVTIGPLSRLWREVRRRGSLPDERELQSARASTGWQNVSLDRGTQTVQLLAAGMSLDLGGIAKGHAADRAVRKMRSLKFNRCFVALAGDIALGDPPPDSEGWIIEVPTTREPKHSSLANCCVSTSGDLEQFIEIAGVRYSHILDPRTGLGVTNRLLVTVIAPRGEDADALASACCVLGWPDCQSLAHQFDDAAFVFQTPLENGVYRTIIDPRHRLRWK